jgi:hypothetical protein
MVYQHGGTNFELVAKTDVPFLRLSSERSKQSNRYQITLDVIPERLTDGSIDSRIVIESNDRDFPKLEVPLRGAVEGAW